MTAAPSITDDRHRLTFWVRRYLPAELAGTAAVVLVGLAASRSIHPGVITVAAVIGESLAFYAFLGIAIYVEQARLVRSRRRCLRRTGALLLAEFGAAEVLDTVIIRPAAVLAAVTLAPDPLWGLLIGKLLADVAFYAIAGASFTLTAKVGLRTPKGDPR